MKTQISRRTHQPAQRYSGVYLQQGRMIVDADWNELSDVVRERLVAALADAVASGAPRQGGLELFLSSGQPRVRPGRLYVDGVPAELAGPGTGIVPNSQPDYPNPPSLPAGNLRFYADVWERSVTALEDPTLMDPGLHGADTATRSQTLLQVKWCASAIDPTASPDNPPLGDAPLTLRLRTIASSGDDCDPCAAEIEVDERIGNYLFRVEVHDLFRSGAETHLVLKWSRDNGAESYPASEVPADFSQGSWVWEFFDTATEKQLGNHFPVSFRARRGLLRQTFDVPNGAGEPNTLVRQWDGYAEINLTTRTLLAGIDRGASLRTDGDDEAAGKVSFDGGNLSINLELLELELGLDGRSFVPGDYWLATVRDAVNASGDTLLTAAPPVGVRHHYLELGQFAGGAIQPPPGVTADAHSRRMRFPPLSDLHASDVAFSQPVACDGIYQGAENVQQALERICDIGAEDVGFTLAEPLPANSVASLLAAQLGPLWPNLDGQPKNPSVQDMLQALLYRANAAALPYTVPGCAATPDTFANLLGLAAGPSQVGSVLQRLLCDLNARHVPLDLSALTCDELRESGETTVQGALDFLCATRIGSCAVTVPVGQLEPLLREFAASDRDDLWLCLLPGEHRIEAPLIVTGKRSLRISAAAAAATTVRLMTGLTALRAAEIGLEGVRIRCAASARLILRGNRITANRCIFSRTSSSVNLPPMVQLEALSSGAELLWRDNAMSDTWSRIAGDNIDIFVNPDVIGNIGVTDAFRELLADGTLVEDPERYDRAVARVAERIAGMSGNDRLEWRDKVNSVTVTDDRRTLAARAPAEAVMARLPLLNNPLLAEAQPLLARANLGIVSVTEAKPVVTTALDRINAAGNDVAAIVDILNDGLIAVLYETGYGVALALAGNGLGGNLTDNEVSGELMLMNGLEIGIDPRDRSLTGRVTATNARLVNGTGHLGLSGNRIQRLWARLPSDSIQDNTLTRRLTGYESMTLTGNQLHGYGHSVVAGLLTVQGNRLLNGQPSGPTPVGKFFTDRSALCANAASFADEFTPLLVAANELEAAGNLMLVSKV